jgi:hypothetical protein
VAGAVVVQSPTTSMQLFYSIVVQQIISLKKKGLLDIIMLDGF